MKEKELIAGQPTYASTKKGADAQMAYRLGQQAAYLQSKAQQLIEQRQKAQIDALGTLSQQMQVAQQTQGAVNALQQIMGEMMKVKADIESRTQDIERSRLADRMVSQGPPADMMGGLPPLPGGPPAGPPGMMPPGGPGISMGGPPGMPPGGPPAEQLPPPPLSM